MPNSIIERLRNGQLVRTMHFTGFVKPRALEMLGVLGNFHGVWIDQEHTAVSHAELDSLLIACRAANLEAFSRVPPTDYCTLMRPMESGCSGVMVAQIRTLAEVHQAVQWSKYPPHGVRGFFGGNYETRFGTVDMAQHVANANRDRWLAIQIETPEAVAIVDEIAALEGVDWLFVGPADLSVTLGVPGDFLHAKCIDTAQELFGTHVHVEPRQLVEHGRCILGRHHLNDIFKRHVRSLVSRSLFMHQEAPFRVQRRYAR